MHLTLESLNHILTVIAVTAFLFSRKDFFKVLFESNLFPATPLNKDVQELRVKLEARIDLKNSPQTILGESIEVLNLDDPQTLKLAKIKAIVISHDLNHERKIKRVNSDGDLRIDRINARFKNTSFFISLLSFFFLIMSAFYSHHVTFFLSFFLFFFNLITLTFLLIFSFSKKVISNLKVLISFFFTVLLSVTSAWSRNAYIHLYDSIKISPYIAGFTSSCQPNGFYHMNLILTLILMLLPWIICFGMFAIIHLDMILKKKKITDDDIVDLKRYSDFLDILED